MTIKVTREKQPDIIEEIRNELFEVVYLDADGFKINSESSIDSEIARAMTNSREELRLRILEKLAKLEILTKAKEELGK